MKYDGSHLFSCGRWLKRGSSRLLANSLPLCNIKGSHWWQRGRARAGIVGRQRWGRSSGQLKGPLNPNLYLMSKGGERGNRARWSRPAPVPRGRSVSTSTCGDRHGPCATARTGHLAAQGWLVIAHMGNTTLLELSSGQFWSHQKDFINSNRLDCLKLSERTAASPLLILPVGSSVLIVAAANIEDLQIFEDCPSNKCSYSHFGQGWKSITTHPMSFGSWKWQET